ncbi:hypothetical protein D3C87_1007300 [compost metagenome]|uniref:hypothetical protein n=1 Tax=Sphingobacterium TaxID=28453 RepID=UPI000F95FE2A|nr:MULTISPECIES: hypothetical protein [Sphingobacterium]QIH35595.1 hypothetical protein G6053_23180 [Sphingobacterium sp. DR205]
MAIIVSSPVAYFYMDSWLQHYPYRSPIPLSAFGLAGISILVIALFTVSYQIVKAILVNPAATLKQ